MRSWLRRVALLMAMLVALTVAMPVGQPRPDGPGEFPLAGLWRLLTTRPGWTFSQPETPSQSRGGSVAGRHEVAGDATRANGGNGRKPGKLPDTLEEFALPAQADMEERLSSKATVGFQAATSRRSQTGISATVDVFENADGSVTRKIYPQPVNFRGADGTWQPIDTRLRRTVDGRWQTTAGEVRLTIAANAQRRGSGPQAALTTEPGQLSGAPTSTALVTLNLPSGEGLAYGLAGAAAVEPSVSGSTASYADILSHTDLQLAALDGGVNETFVLKSVQAPAEWIFPLTLHGLTPRIEPDDSISLLDGSGAVKSVIPHGSMWDSYRDAAGEAAMSNSVTYQLVTVDGGPALKMTADADWIRDPARVFPIMVDPTISPPGNASTYVQRRTSGTACCTNNNTGTLELKVGSHSSGPWETRSFVKFDAFSSGYLGHRISSANLKVNVAWSGTCPSTSRTSAVRVHDVGAWTPSAVTNWSNQPAVGGSMGELTKAPTSAVCANGDPDTPAEFDQGDWWSIPLNANGINVLNRWTAGGTNNGVAISADLNSDDTWKKLSSVNTARKPNIEITYTPNESPKIEALHPPQGYASPTLTPELVVTASDADAWPQALTYTFRVTDTDGVEVDSSGPTPIASRNWVVTAGKLQWGKTYLWAAVANDGASPSVPFPAYTFTTQVPQPLITSGLSQNSSQHGFEPQVGNYTTQETDAHIAGVGPSLAIQRSYNSRDPRVGSAFGSGWSNLLDSRMVKQTGMAIITYPNGQDVAFAENADGSFTPPTGGQVTSLKPATGGGYVLTDPAKSKYAFTLASGPGEYRLASVTDAHGRSLTLASFVSGRPTKITSTSGRSLYLAWFQPPSATAWHVESVITDPATPGDWNTANTWKYIYDGDRLSKACPPTNWNKCTTYTYGSNSLFSTAVLDANPHTYLRLAETGPAAPSSTTDSLAPATGIYHGSVATDSAELVGSAATAARFDGTASYAELTSTPAVAAKYQSVSLRFRANPGDSGVLYALAKGTTSYPVLYIGTDGKLRGEFKHGTINPITSGGTVNDTLWHHVVLTMAASVQTLYLDGQQVGTFTDPQVADSDAAFALVAKGTWSGWPATSGTDSYFKGSVSDLALYARPLAATHVASLYQVSQVIAAPLERVYEPSGNVRAVVQYDALSGIVRKVTDSNTGEWQINDPVRSNPGHAYRSVVLSRAPRDYFRFNDLGPSTAVNVVNGGVATYNQVSLGVDGGPFGDDVDVASFNGSTSYVKLPKQDAPDNIAGGHSVSLWFKVPAGSTTGGVLFSYGNKQLNDADLGLYSLPLYVGADGKLRGFFYNVVDPPMESATLVNDGKWHHAALAASGNTQRLYLDGAQVGSRSGGAFTVNWAEHVYVGAGPWKYWPGVTASDFGYFTGQIAEVAYYRSELSAEHVAGQYLTRPKTGSEDPAFTSVPAKIVSVVDPAGHQIQNVFDLSAGGRQIEVVDARGKRTSFGYDTGGFLRTITDPNGNTTITEHDVRGNVRAKTSCQDMSANICSTTYYEYYLNSGDPTDLRNDKLLKMRDPRSSTEADNRYVTTYSYDALGNLIEVADPLGRSAKHDFTNGTDVVTDVSNLVASGRFVRILATKRSGAPGYSLNEFEVYGSDCRNLAAGKPVTASTVQSGTTAGNATDGHPGTRWQSDPFHPQWITVDLGAVTSISRVRLNWGSSYGVDFQVQVDDPITGWGSVYGVTGHPAKAVPAGLTSRIVSPGGAVQTISYDNDGDVVRTVDAAGLATCHKQDGLGRVIEQTVSSSSNPSLVTSITYDRLDRVFTMIEPRTRNWVTGAEHTRKTTYDYDFDGHPRAVEFSDLTGGDAARTVSMDYNDRGQKVSQSDAKDNRVAYEYDLFGQVIKQTEADGTITETAYDATGSQITLKVNGQVIESRAYDDGGRLASVTDALNWQTRYTYTDNNLRATATRMESENGPGFLIESNVYDAAGNLTSQASNNGVTVSTTGVDPAGRTAWTTLDAGGVNRSISYSYGAEDQVLSQTLSGPSGSQTTDSLYDPAGRLIWQGVRMPAGTGGPTSWWQLNETSGSTAADSTSGGKTGTIFGGVSWSDGAAKLDGTGDIYTSPPVLDTTNSYTISAWAKTNGVNGAVVAQDSSIATGLGSGFSLYHGTNWGFVKPVGDGGWAATWLDSNTPAMAGVWTHLVAIYDKSAGKVKLYINGVLKAELATPAGFAANGPLTIGRDRINGAPANRFNGFIDNVQVYQRAVADSDVSALYTKGRVGGALAQTSIAKSWTVDQQGRVTAETDPNGDVTRFSHDQAGRLVQTESPTVTTEDNSVVTNAPVVVTTGYDTFGGVAEQRDGRGLVMRYELDANGRVTKRHAPSYTAPGMSTPLLSTTEVAYDVAGRVDNVKDPLGRQTFYTYDQFGHVKTVKTPDLGVTTYTYHPDGEPASVTDPSGARMEATHDYLGRPATQTQLVRHTGQPAEALTTRYAYLAGSGWLEKVISPDLSRGQTRYEYNNAGEVIKSTDAAGNISLATYDFAGRVTTAQLPDGSKRKVTFDDAGRPLALQELKSDSTVLRTTSATYDGNGNPLTTTDGRGTMLSFTYDAIGQLTRATQPVSAVDPPIVTTFGYSANGQRTRFTDGRDYAFRTTFNAWNLPESVIEPDGSTFTSTYDLAGRLDKKNSPGGVSLTFSYDVMDNLTRIVGAGAEIATQDRVYGYDAVGRVTSLSGSGGTNNLSYDDRGLLTSVTGPSGDSSFTYTADSLMQSRTDAAGTTNYTYDNVGRLQTAGNSTAGLQLTYGYNSLSQVDQITYGTSQNRRRFTYDDLHRLTRDELKTAVETSIATIIYGWDANDNETSKQTINFAGASTNSYTYDWANRLLSWNAVQYAYDKSGNRTRAGSKTFYYDSDNKLSSDSSGTQYEYTARGTLRRTTVGTVPLETLSDAFDQVIKQYSSPTQFSQYSYDGLGRAIQTGFAYAGTGNDLAKDATATYMRDPAGGLLGSKSGSAATFAWTDLHTDVVGQFTATGSSLSGSTSYDPLGKVITSSSVQGSLGYQSEWTDSSTKRVNMHARWYNTETGQFDSRDTVSNSPVPNSINANRFAYANANPMTLTDPSGHAVDLGFNGTDPLEDESTKPPCLRDPQWFYQHGSLPPSCSTTTYDPGWGNETGFNGRTGPTVNNCAHGNYDWIFPNCTGVGTYGDGTTCIGDKFSNQMCFSAEQLAGLNPTILAAEIDKEVGRRGGYGDTAHYAAILSSVVLTQAINNAVERQAALDENNAKAEADAKCKADFWCKNAGWIGTVAGVIAGVVAGGVCLALTAGAGSILCAALGGFVGGFVGGLTTGALQGKQGWDLWGGALLDGVIGGVLGALTMGAGMALGAAVRGLISRSAGSAAGSLIRGAGSAATSALRSAGARISASAIGKGVTVARSAIARVEAKVGSCTMKVAGESAVGSAAALAMHSFDPATGVLMADGTVKPIGEVAVGDKVTATDPDTDVTTSEQVTALHEHLDADLVDVLVAPASDSPSTDIGHGDGDRSTRGPTATLHTTVHHPFWDASDGQWIDAQLLRPGHSTLIGPDGQKLDVAGVRPVLGVNLMRDLTVANVHTYYVFAGETPVLVHNCDSNPTPHVHRTDRGPLTRTDGRSPEDIVEAGGFQPWNPAGNNDLQIHVEQNLPGNLVSASRNLEPVGAHPWLYDIDAPGGIDLNATATKYGNLNPNWGENEVTFPGGIPLRFIRGAQQYDEFDNPVGDYWHNRLYRP